MTQDPPFWKTKPLDALSPNEWESLCDNCGRCCLQKLREETTGELFFTNVACHLLDLQTCRCSNYEKRQQYVPDCMTLTCATLKEIDWLPPSCAYRLLFEGHDLPDWHPLNSQTSESVHAVGASGRGRLVSEVDAEPIETCICAWPGQWPKPEILSVTKKTKRPARRRKN